jgi:signal transduction histidine kinase
MKTQEIVRDFFVFVKRNPKIIYSLILFIAIPSIIFGNTWFIVSGFEKNIDSIIQSKAVLIEEVLGFSIVQNIDDVEKIQSIIHTIVENHEEIIGISILVPKQEGDFEYIASSREDIIGERTKDVESLMAWHEEEAIAHLRSDGNNRFWNVTRAIQEENKKVGLVSLAFSLKNTDGLVNATLNQIYWILFVSIGVIIFLVANQARLFRYVYIADRLREVDKMKDAFISMASHELRSPLTAVKGYIELLSDKQKQNIVDEESEHYANNIKLSVTRLDGLVNDILEVSRLEGDRIPINMEVFDPKSILDESIEEMLPFALQKNIKLYREQDNEKGYIYGDKERSKQIFINLISNGLKYTKEGEVKIRTSIKGDVYTITFADTGIGISSEDQKKLFQKFSRIANKNTQGIIGTGLGLWIIAELAKKMGATITVESIEGVGSHFSVHFPLIKNKKEKEFFKTA